MAKKLKCDPGCPNKFDETCCRSRGESPDLIPVESTERRIDNLGKLLAGSDLNDLVAVPVSQVVKVSNGPSIVTKAQEARQTLNSLTAVDVANGKGLDALSLIYGVALREPREVLEFTGLAPEPVERELTIQEQKDIAWRERYERKSKSTGVLPDGARKCLRCDRPAVSNHGGAKWQKLCHRHNELRRESQAKSHRAPKCGCGNMMPLVGSMCSRCQLAQDRLDAPSYVVDADGAPVDLRLYQIGTLQTRLKKLSYDLQYTDITQYAAAREARHIAELLEDIK